MRSRSILCGITGLTLLEAVRVDSERENQDRSKRDSSNVVRRLLSGGHLPAVDSIIRPWLTGGIRIPTFFPISGNSLPRRIITRHDPPGQPLAVAEQVDRLRFARWELRQVAVQVVDAGDRAAG